MPNNFLTCRRVTAGLVAVLFAVQSLVPASARAQGVVNQTVAPAAGLLGLSPAFSPALIRGLQIYPDNPLRFDFMLDRGDSSFREEALAKEAGQLVRYFMAALTVPENDLWVNLSPYEANRIAPEAFGQTEMGKDLLAQDYVLKQLTASLLFPDKELGEKFWQRVKDQAVKAYGTNDVNMGAFHKIWIVPAIAEVYETNNTVYIVNARLKVMLEEDYKGMKMENGRGKIEDAVNPSSPVNLPTSILKEIVLPEIEKEVNEGKQFALLRQIYVSVILATWFKRNLKESLLGKTYVEKNKIKGIETDDLKAKEKIYEQYLETFKKGVYNFVKEEYDPATQSIVNRQYVSGGVTLSFLGEVPLASAARDAAMTSMEKSLPGSSVVHVILKPLTDAAHQQAIDKAVLTRVDETNVDGDFAMLSVLDKLRYPGTFSPVHRMIRTIKKPQDRYLESLYALSPLQQNANIVSIWNDLNASYQNLVKIVSRYKNQTVLQSTMAGDIFTEYEKEMNVIHQRNLEWAVVLADFLWPASMRKNQKFQKIRKEADSVWRRWQEEVKEDLVSEDPAQIKRRSALKEILSMREKRDSLGMGAAERGAAHQQLKNKISQAAGEALSGSQKEILHKFAAKVYSLTLTKIGKLTNDRQRHQMQTFIQSFMAHVDAQDGEALRFYNGQPGIEWEDLFEAASLGVMTKGQEDALNAIVGEHLNTSFTLAQAVDVTKKGLKISGLAVMVAGMLMLFPDLKIDVGNQTDDKSAAEVVTTEKPKPLESTPDEQKKRIEQEKIVQTLLALVKVTDASDALVVNTQSEAAKKERQEEIKALEAKIQTLQAEVQKIEKQTQAAEQEAEVAEKEVHKDFQELEKSVEQLPSAQKMESSEDQKAIEEEEEKKKTWLSAPESKPDSLEGEEGSLAFDPNQVPRELDDNPVLRDAVMDIGDGDGTDRFSALKARGIRAHVKSSYLSLGHYSRIDIDNSKKLSRQPPEYRSWEIDRGARDFEEYINLDSRGKSIIPIVVPTGYVVAGVLTTHSVERLGVFYDQANGVWVVVTGGDAGELKIGVRPAKPFELPEIKTMEFVNGQGESIDVRNFLKGILPPKMFQIVELLKDRPRKDQINVLRELMRVFIYSTNPLFNDPLSLLS